MTRWHSPTEMPKVDTVWVCTEFQGRYAYTITKCTRLKNGINYKLRAPFDNVVAWHYLPIYDGQLTEEV